VAASADVETLRMYYSMQYQRIAQHESGRLQVSNFVVAASVIALGLLVLPKKDVSWSTSVVPLAVTVVNTLAILYSRQARFWVKLHQARAEAVLTEMAPQLVSLQRTVDASKRRPNSDKDPLRSQLLQSYIHITIALVGILIFVGWL
jgi:hypothetical protein